ncbi:MAG: phosphoribosyl-ATP diphosphatase [Clostridiales Family XIII bacterium]|jgi:phosphoribosyl-ATP pyrophosphohydrolase|nr:phosphoribosyl-ATP diphosphatase [Clostridiales Family XIII bacterium]
MSDVIRDLYEVVLSRREAADENSYTAYLFREGIDKILKKIGEESSEVIIAAKSHEAASLRLESEIGRPPSLAGSNGADAQLLDNNRAGAEPPEGLRSDLKNEVADLVYHLLVMLAERGLDWSEVEGILAERAAKAGNLKQMKDTDRNS